MSDTETKPPMVKFRDSRPLDEETERALADVHCRRPRALADARARVRQIIEEAMVTARQQGFDDCRARLTYD